MNKHKRLADLDTLSNVMFAEFGFHSLTDDQKEKVLEFYVSKIMKGINPE